MSDLINRQEAIEVINGVRIRAMDNSEDVSRIWECADAVLQMPSAKPKIIRCKDCTHFHYDFWANVNGIPLIVGHEICDFWGDGCKTKEDGFCSYAERAEE